MKAELVIEECKSVYCVVHSPVSSDRVLQLVDRIAALDENGDRIQLMGWDGDYCSRLEPKDICRIFSMDKKVFVETKKGTMTLKMRLYEFEELCAKNCWQDFIRISNTDIVNFSHVRNLDLSLSGVIKVNLDNGTVAIVSRRYMSKIRSKLCLRK